MPPRIPVSQVARCLRTSIEHSGTSHTATSAAPLVSLLAVLSLHPPSFTTTTTTTTTTTLSQSRSASILSNLRDNAGAYNKRIRKGRGASSGYGKTSGRGHKGQGQHGKVKPWFQGGQTPLIFKHGRMGFVNHGKADMAEVTVTRLQAWIDTGRLDPKRPITPKELIRSRLVTRFPDGIKLLASGRFEKAQLKQPIDIVVSRASRQAIQAVEAAGGQILTRYYTKDSIRRLVKGLSDNSRTPLPVGKEYVAQELAKLRSGPFKYRLPDPVNRWDIEYYRDPAHRGYLSYQLQPGESPSLYFRVPGADEQEERLKRASKAKKVVDPDLLFQI